MRHIESHRDIPGIPLGSYATAEDVRESRAAGFDFGLAKPITFSKLERTIRGVIADAD